MPQPLLQSQNGIPSCTQDPHVHPPHTQPTPSPSAHTPGRPQYDLSFPALPEQHGTSWTKVPYKKRPRDTPENQTQSTKQPTLTDYWLNQPSTSTTNKFAVLMAEGMEEMHPTPQPPNPRPPPIFVDGVQNINPLRELLVGIAGDDFELKVLQGNQVKIQPKSSDKYTTIIKALTEKRTEFHTYQPKADRSFRTVLRGLHYSTDTKDIKSEIESLGHTVVNIFNIKQSRTNIPLPLFFVDLKPGPNNKAIYLIETLHYTKVKFEPPRPKRTIPQCSKCQRYGHTQAYCFRSPRCVKCAGSHHTAQCQRKEKSDNVTCVLCNGNHPANYKGCSIYKDLQKRTFPPLRKKFEETHPSHLLQPTIAATSSYATALKSSPTPLPLAAAPSNATAHKSSPSPPPPVDASQPQRQPTHGPRPQPPPTDMQELRDMMKGLMDQMGTMLNLLTTLVSKLN